MEYYIDIQRKKRNTAGLKAPEDIAELCKRRGMKKYEFPLLTNKKGIMQKVWILFIGSFYWIKLLFLLKKNDIILYQHPMYGHRISNFFVPIIKKIKKSKFIVVIHDLESLRKGISGTIDYNKKTSNIADIKLLNHFDRIICHNEKMKEYLISKNFIEKKLVCLEIFDYLTSIQRMQPQKSDNPSIAIAGYLAKEKSGYIYKILDKKNKNLVINLYGNKYDETIKKEHMVYHGSFTPEELPNYLIGDFGLVWDGLEANSCVGNTGEYLKYNNPHKTSLYLSSNMPVIVWKKAAIADFIIKNNVGIVVDNLFELEEKISSITLKEYEQICKNTQIISKQLKEGYYFYKALETCLKSLEML